MATSGDKNIYFINLLRAFAAIIVLISHIFFMYYSGDASRVLEYLAPPSVEVSLIKSIYSALGVCGISFGHLGVSIFFLISGFCACLSAEHKSFFNYLVSRIKKIYPTYIIAFSITFLNIFVYTKLHGIKFPYTFRDWLIQVSLIRDWLWHPSVDGLSWTLEVQLKLYLVLSLCFLLIKSKAFKNKIQFEKLIPFLYIGSIIVMAIFNGILKCTETASIYPYAIWYVICFNVPLVAYALIGSSLYQHYMGRISNKELLSHIVLGVATYLFGFSWGIFSTGVKSRICSYSIGLVIFCVAYFVRAIEQNSIIKWLTRISYALYAVQGSAYVIMSVMDWKLGLNPYLIIIVTGLILIVLANIVTIIIEVISKSLNK